MHLACIPRRASCRRASAADGCQLLRLQIAVPNPLWHAADVKISKLLSLTEHQTWARLSRSLQRGSAGWLDGGPRLAFQPAAINVFVYVSSPFPVPTPFNPFLASRCRWLVQRWVSRGRQGRSFERHQLSEPGMDCVVGRMSGPGQWQWDA